MESQMAVHRRPNLAASGNGAITILFMSNASGAPCLSSVVRPRMRVTMFIALLLIAAGCKPVLRPAGPGDFTERDVQKFITPGQPVAEVTNRFGVPRSITTNQFNQIVMYFHSGLPETIRTNDYVFSGFHLWSTNEKVMRWRTASYSKIGE